MGRNCWSIPKLCTVKPWKWQKRNLHSGAFITLRFHFLRSETLYCNCHSRNLSGSQKGWDEIAILVGYIIRFSMGLGTQFFWISLSAFTSTQTCSCALLSNCNQAVFCALSTYFHLKQDAVVLTIYPSISQGSHIQALKIFFLIFQWYFKTKIPNFHDNCETLQNEKKTRTMVS